MAAEISKPKKKLTPFLWFDNNAEEAMNFYVSAFKDSKVISVNRYGDAGPGPKDSVMTATFELCGVQFTALNGGPLFNFNESVSFVIHCDNQEEVDWYWEKLSDGGQKSRCGWLKDQFGLSWQVVPLALFEFTSGEDKRAANRVMQAMLKMDKMDIGKLREAYDNKA